MASAEARALKEAHPSAQVVVGDGEREIWSEIFAGNPNITRLATVQPGEKIVWLRNYRGCRPYLDYTHSQPNYRQSFTAYHARSGDLFLSSVERAYAASVLRGLRDGNTPLISVEPNVDFGPNKDWGFERWQQVVDHLQGRAQFVQPSFGKPVLSGVVGVPSTFRGFCAVLACCDLHMGPEGGLHHAAAALARPAVVLFGGRLHPEITGYSFHENVYVDGPESPCGMIAPCSHCRSCLDAIQVSDVVARVVHLLGVHRRGLSTGDPSAPPGIGSPVGSNAGSAERSPRV